jgi:predicted AAA+ superfamily ATPase
MKLVDRPYYLKKLEAFQDTQLIKVLIGQRRAGKSSILRLWKDKLAQKFPEHLFIDINMEDPAFSSIMDAEALLQYLKPYLDASKKHQSKVLCIDEVQEIKNFEKTLRYLVALPDWDVYITGSNARLLSGELATLLSGRYIEIPIYPLAFPEFIRFHKLSANMDALQRYIDLGGLPYLKHLPSNPAITKEYLAAIESSIILKDVIERYKVRNVHFLKRLMHFLADDIGNMLSARRISQFLKSQHINISTRLVLEYINYLENVFYISRVRRMEVEGRKIFEVGDKFYFNDLGLRHIQTPYSPADIGDVMENLVHNHLKYQGYELFVGKMGDREIDFIAQKGDEICYFQVCYLLTEPKTVEREFGNLLAIPDNHPKTVISLDPLSGRPHKGIEHLNLLDFLSD